MIFSDRIYGVMEIKEPVIRDIIKTPELQRLHGVLIGGWCPANPFHALPISRYEHSVGVLMLLKKHGATLEEQIAGLIHDLNLPAFSHVCDTLFGNEEQQRNEDFHEETYEEFVRNSETGKVISSYGYNLDYILDDKNFPLKENNLPDICADRIDYSLRTVSFMKQHGKLLWADEVKMADGFISTKDGFICKNKEMAKDFARVFNETDEQKYSTFDNFAYRLNMARTLKKALVAGIVTKEDFFVLDDSQMLKKMYDAGIDMSLMYKDAKEFIPSGGQPSETGFAKCRRIDPAFMDSDGKIKKLSAVCNEYAEYMKKVPKYLEHKVKIK